MISVKEAFEASKTFLQEVYPDTSDLDVSLEEVELSDNDDYWYVTLGFDRKGKPTAASTGLEMFVRGLNPQRAFKIFTVDARSGSVRAMKIRQ